MREHVDKKIMQGLLTLASDTSVCRQQVLHGDTKSHPVTQG